MTKSVIIKIMPQKAVIMIVITLLLSALSIFAISYIPVEITIEETPTDSLMKPYGPITIENPYKECFPSNELKGDFINDAAVGATLELYMATYQQRVDADYSVVLDDLSHNAISSGVLSAYAMEDNKYQKAVTIHQALTQSDQICLHIKPLGKNPTHPLTIWLNSQSQPVLRVKKQMPLYEALNYLSERSPFQLGKEFVFGLCLAYLIGIIGFTSIICYTAHEQEDL